MLTVITGPPAAGKSTWIKAHAKPGDIVIDYDVIARSIAGPGASTHEHTDAAQKIAHRMRFAAIDEALTLCDTTDVYLIHSQPKAKDQAKYRRFGARVVEIDPGKDEVMARVRAQRRPGMVGVVTRWYSQRAKAQPTQRVTAQRSRDW